MNISWRNAKSYNIIRDNGLVFIICGIFCAFCDSILHFVYKRIIESCMMK